MKTQLVRIDPANPDIDKIQRAAAALKKGRLVVFPTETVYGLGANAKNKKAMARLRRLKERPTGPFSYHIALKPDLKKLGCIIDKPAKKLINKFWPGPLTLILKTRLGEDIGVRMPAHPVALALVKKAAVPVVAPSANLKDKRPAVTARQAFRDLSGLVDIIIDSGRTKIIIS